MHKRSSAAAGAA